MTKSKKKHMTLEGFLRKFRQATKGKSTDWELWLGSMIRHKRPRVCPIEYVANKDNAFTEGPEMGLSERDTLLIIAAADDESTWALKGDKRKVRGVRRRLLMIVGLEKEEARTNAR